MQGTNVPNTQTQHIKNNAQGTNAANHQTEHIQNSAENTNLKKIVQNAFKTMREKLPYQTITQHTQNTFKTVRKMLT